MVIDARMAKVINISLGSYKSEICVNSFSYTKNKTRKISTYIIGILFLTFSSPAISLQFESKNSGLSMSAATTERNDFQTSLTQSRKSRICLDSGSFANCLQEESAIATVKSATYSKYQILISSLIGILTLSAAVAAAFFSGKAAIQARNAVSVALKVGAAQIRPYIILEIKLEKNEGYLKKGVNYDIIYLYKNIGKSEGILTNQYFIFEKFSSKDKYTSGILNTENQERFISKSNFTEFMDNVFGENLLVYPDRGPSKISFGLSDEKIEDAVANEEDFIIAMIVDYKDNIGYTYRSACAYRAKFAKSPGGIFKYTLVKYGIIITQQDKLIGDVKF